MVVRGGFGLAYFPGNYMSQSFMKNQPFVSAYGPVLSGGTTGGGAPTLRLADGLPLPVAPDYDQSRAARSSASRRTSSRRASRSST